MIFENRKHAGELLAEEIAKLKLDPKDSVVAAIPRGGVIVGDVIAKRLKLPLICIVIKKLGAPENAELAIGATASFGKAVLDRWLIRDLKIPADWLKQEIIKRRKEAKARENFLGIEILGENFHNKNVIIVDDGIATGQTARAAAKIIRRFEPAKLILAVGCGSPQTLAMLGGYFDQIICPVVSSDLWAVGQFYHDFRPVEDNDVKAIY